MLFSYDSRGDLLEVIFDESLHTAEQRAYELRKGIVLYFTVKDFKLVQLTLVGYRELSQLPVVDFAGWRKLTASAKKRLLPIITFAPLTSFFKLDPKTGSGHVIFPPRARKCFRSRREWRTPMRLSYDPEGDILEVVFSEQLQRVSKKSFQLRHGIVLYLAKESVQPVQLTLCIMAAWRSSHSSTVKLGAFFPPPTRSFSNLFSLRSRLPPF